MASNGNGTSTGDRLVGRFTEASLLKRAKEVVAEKSQASEIFDEEAEKSLPRFKKSGGYYELRRYLFLPNLPMGSTCTSLGIFSIF